jgi:predicted MFS family arabinose efflux permease
MFALVRLYRDAFGGLPRLTWLLCTAAFLNRCGSMVVPLLGPYLKKEFQFTPDEAGWVVGLYGIGAMLGSWLGGRLTDRIGPVRLQVLALGCSALWMLLMTQFHTATNVVAAVFVLGVVNDAFRPGSNTAAAMSAPLPLRRKALSLNRFALNLGWAFGPTIGGYLVVHDLRVDVRGRRRHLRPRRALVASRPARLEPHAAAVAHHHRARQAADAGPPLPVR